MRELNKEQRNILNDWFNEYGDKAGIFFDLAKCDNFSLSLLRKLEKINDFETLNQEVNNYINQRVQENWQ